MARWTIRQGMLGVAGVAVLLGGYVGSERSLCRYVCTRSGQCASKQRNVALALVAYADSRGSFPSGTWPNAGLTPGGRLSWYYVIAHHLDEQDLQQEVDNTEPWYGPTNAPIAGKRLSVLACPDASPALAGGPVPTAYIGIAGLGADAPVLPAGHPRAGIFGYDRQTTLKEIIDGTSSTMVLAESGRVQGSWLAGGPATVRGLDTADLPYLGPGRQFGGLHQPRGANVAFADGSVRFISETIDPHILEALSTIAGGERLPPDLFR